MNILVVGATGVLGQSVIPRLLERGHRVRAVVGRREQASFLEQIRVEPIIGDLLDRRSLEHAARGSETALYLAPALAGPAQPDSSFHRRVLLEGVRNLLEVLSRTGVKRYIGQSTTLVYGENGQAIVDESAPVQVTPLTRPAAEMETLIRSAELQWTILRGGLLYGPGTGREESWWQAARNGRLRLPGDGSDLVSLVHVVDMARAVVSAAERDSGDGIYNIVDDEPVSTKDLFSYISAQVGQAAPLAGGPKFLPSLGVKNIKAQLELAWRPVYPGYPVGLAYGRFDGNNGGQPDIAPPHLVDLMQAEVTL
jgi:nucleoside-diphosphate-sugar epimerase